MDDAVQQTEGFEDKMVYSLQFFFYSFYPIIFLFLFSLFSFILFFLSHHLLLQASTGWENGKFGPTFRCSSRINPAAIFKWRPWTILYGTSEKQIQRLTEDFKTGEIIQMCTRKRKMNRVVWTLNLSFTLSPFFRRSLSTTNSQTYLGSSSNNVSISFTRANRAAVLSASRHILAPTRYEARAIDESFVFTIFFWWLFETQSPSKFLFMLCLTVLRWNSASKQSVIAFPHGPIWGTAAARKSPTPGTPLSLEIAKPVITSAISHMGYALLRYGLSTLHTAYNLHQPA